MRLSEKGRIKCIFAATQPRMSLSLILIVLSSMSNICSQEHYYYDFYDQQVTLMGNPKFLKIDKYNYNLFGEITKVISKLRTNIANGKNTIDSGFIDKLDTATTLLQKSLTIPAQEKWEEFFYEKPPAETASCHSQFKNAQLEIRSLKQILNMETPMDTGAKRRKRQSDEVTAYLTRFDSFFTEKNELSDLAFNKDALALLTDILELDQLDYVAFKITGKALDQLGRTRKTQERELIKVIRTRIESDRTLSDTYKRTRNSFIATMNEPISTTEQSNKRTLEPDDDLSTSEAPKVLRNSIDQTDVRSDATTEADIGPRSTEKPSSDYNIESVQKDLSYLTGQTLKLASGADQNRVNDLASVINDLIAELDTLREVFSEGSLSEINQLCNTRFVGIRRKEKSTIVYTSQITAATLITIPFCSEYNCYQLERKHLALKLETGRFCLNGEPFTEDKWICKTKLQLNGPPCKMAKEPTKECQFKSMTKIGEELKLLNFGTAILNKRSNTIYQNLADEEKIVGDTTLAPKVKAFQVGYNTNMTFFLDMETIKANFNTKDGYWNQILRTIKNSEHSHVILNLGLALSVVGILLFIIQALCYCLPKQTNLRENSITLDDNAQELNPLRPNYQLVRFADGQ